MKSTVIKNVTIVLGPLGRIEVQGPRIRIENVKIEAPAPFYFTFVGE